MTKPPAGNMLALGMEPDAYFAIEALSQSGAKKLLRSPLHYKLEREAPKPPTDTMQFGTAVHFAVLQPDAFLTKVACAPDVDRRTNVGKERWAQFEATLGDALVLSAEAYKRALACADAVRAHPAAAKLLEGAEVELSFFWQDARHKVPCKARWDARNLGGCVDLKTCADASPEAFGRACATFGYNIQEAHYRSAAEHVFNASPAFFAFIAVESEPPHAVACYTLPSAAVLKGQAMLDLALERYAQILATGEFPGYPETIDQVPFPAWALRG